MQLRKLVVAPSPMQTVLRVGLSLSWLCTSSFLLSYYIIADYLEPIEAIDSSDNIIMDIVTHAQWYKRDLFLN